MRFLWSLVSWGDQNHQNLRKTGPTNSDQSFWILELSWVSYRMLATGAMILIFRWWHLNRSEANVNLGQNRMIQNCSMVKTVHHTRVLISDPWTFSFLSLFSSSTKQPSFFGTHFPIPIRMWDFCVYIKMWIYIYINIIYIYTLYVTYPWRLYETRYDWDPIPGRDANSSRSLRRFACATPSGVRGWSTWSAKKHHGGRGQKYEPSTK